MIKPLHDNVILKKEEVENKTSSGIILTTETKKIPSATVVAVGPECKAEIKENDKVVYKEYSGTNIEIDEVEYIVISVKDILASIA